MFNRFCTNIVLSLDLIHGSLPPFLDSASEVPEDEALMHLKLQPEGDLFPCCDGTEEISQSSSNDTPAPERTVCQPCSTGSHLVPNTREEEVDNDKEVISSERDSEQEDESQEEVSEDEEQEEQIKNVVDAEAETSEERVEAEEPQTHKSHGIKEESGPISGKLMADAAPMDKSEAPAGTKVSVEDIILAAEPEPDVAQTKKVEKVVEKMTVAEKEQPLVKESVSEEPVRKSSMKGTIFQCINV